MKVTQLCQFFATPWTIQSWNSLGQNTGVGSLSFSRGFFQPRAQTQVSHIAAGFLTSWTREAQESWRGQPFLQQKIFDSKFLGRLIRSLRSPRRRKRSGALGAEIGVWGSQRGGKDKQFFFFPLSTFLSLSHIKRFFL